MKFNFYKIVLLKFIIVLLISFSNYSFAIKTPTGSGNWTSVTWSPGGVPTSTDDVQIPANLTITINSTGLACKSLTISSSGTVNYPTSGTCDLTVNGSLTISSSGTFNCNTGGTSKTLSVLGSFSNSGTFTANNTVFTLIMLGTSAQTINGNITSSTIGSLTINNTAGVTLGVPVSISKTLTLTNGLLITSSNLLTITNSATNAISGGSSSSYVSGPLCRTLPNNASNATYTFPVGKSAYQLFELVSTTTGGSGTATFTAEAFDANASGTAGYGMYSLNTNRYWKLNGTLGTVTLTSSTVRLTESGLSSTSKISQSNTSNGTYVFKGGTLVSSTLLTTRTLDFSALSSGTYFVIGTGGLVAGTIAVGNSYPLKLTDVKKDLNELTVFGNLTYEMAATYVGTSGETFPIAFNQFATSGGSWKVKIRPASGVSSIITSGDPGSNNPLIDLSGVNNLTFDGRAGGSGSTIAWLVRNTRTAANVGATFRFINDAIADTLMYLQIEGQDIVSSSGTILFSTTTGTKGNYNNAVKNCNIGDRSDAVGLPTNAIYSVGTTGYENSSNSILNNNIYNFFNAAANTSGIYIGSSNNTWTISGNNFYQTATRTCTAASALYYGININCTTGNNFTVSNNYIGGSTTSAGGSAFTISGTGNCRFVGINMAAGTTTASNIQGNTIANISINPTPVSGNYIFYGMNITSGNVNVGSTSGNTIGNNTVYNSINCSTLTNPSTVVGIYSSSTGTVLIQNNVIGGITANSVTAGNPNTIYPIQTAGTAGNYNISNNTIGSSSLNANIRAGLPSSTASCILYGITNSATGTISISNNTIANLTTYGTGTAGSLRGINNSAGTSTISNNTIKNLNTYSQQAGTNGSAAVIGLTQTSSVVGVTVSKNTIFAMADSTASSAAVTVTGIYYSGPTTGTNVISQNNVNSFTTISTSASQQGINYVAGLTSIQNNIIRLGLDYNGSSVTTSSTITGLLKQGGNSSCYFNTIYVGGSSVVSGTINTYAYRRTGGTIDTLKNNIFVNSRSNTSGAGKNFAYVINSITNVISDYNIFRANGTGGTLASVNGGGTALTTTIAFRGAFTNQEVHSGFGDPKLSNPDANSSTFSLQITNTSPAEGTGKPISSVTVDYLNQTRASFSPTDIGAYAGNFTAPTSSTNIFTPYITYLQLSNDNSSPTRTLTNFATIGTPIASIGINTTTGTKPRLYYKLSTENNAFGANDNTFNGWKYVEATGTTSPFSFVINYNFLKTTIASGNTVQYFIIAQDLCSTPNVWSSPCSGLVATSISSITTAPTPATYIYSTTTIGGAVYVGSGQTFTSLTNAGGLFAAINTNNVNDTITATITSDITELGTNPLNQWNETGGSGFKLIIQSDGNARTISGTGVSSGAAMIKINGADRVTIDGGSSKLLTFRNTNSTPGNTGPVFLFDNGSTSCTIKNCNIECNNTNTGRGSISISGTGGGTNAKITISNNNIYDAVAGTTGPTAIGIYSSSNAADSALTITNNNFYNWTNYGIFLSAIGNNNIIDNNNFYNNQVTPPSVSQTAIYLQSANANNQTITNNYIGGQSANCGGSAFTNTGSGAFKGMSISLPTGTTSSIANNTIQSISLTGTGSVSFSGIEVVGGQINVTGNIVGQTSSIQSAGTGAVKGITLTEASATFNVQNNIVQNYNLTGSAAFTGIEILNGASTVSGNTIGSNTLSNNIQVSGTGSTIGIYANASTNSITINNNIVANITSSGTGTGVAIRGIVQNGTGATNIQSNTIHDLSTASSNTSTVNMAAQGIYVSGAASSAYINSNTIYSVICSNSTDVLNNASGITITAATSPTISQNKIYDIRNNSLGTTTVPTASGISIVSPTNSTVNISNNMVTLGYNQNTNTKFLGIWLNASTTYIANIYYNSVYINGTAPSSGTLPTFGFFRDNNCNNPNTNIINNIFANDRTGTSSSHYAIGNQATSNANANKGWNASGCSSDYNFLISQNANTLGLWVATAYSYSSWLTNSLTDAHSINASSSNATAYNSVILSNLFNDYTNGDLSINQDKDESWFVNGNGLPNSIVSSDYNNSSRSTSVTVGASDIGAEEVTPSNLANPIPCGVTGSLTVSGTGQTFTFAGRTVATIDWTAGTDLPTDISCIYYSGVNPASNLSGSASNAYWTITPTGGTIYTYTVNLYYTPAILGTITNEANIGISKSDSIWHFYSTSTVNTTTDIATLTNQNSFCDFIISQFDNPLPIELVSFNGIYENNLVKLYWAVASETNNDYYIIEKSIDGVNFTQFAKVKGHGNSNILLNYVCYDYNSINGVVYYRLKQVDFDGDYTYYNTIFININKDNISSKLTAEQPYNDGFYIITNIKNISTPSFNIEIFNLNGNEVYNNLINSFRTDYTVKINSNVFIKGNIYLMMIYDGKETIYKKFYY